MAQIAQDSIQISELGEYQIGNRIYKFDTYNDTKFFTDFRHVVSEVNQKPKNSDCKIEVRNEGTVDAVFRLSKGNQKNMSLGVLNFASAYNPGGGFESGAMAQEECLAYCSDLYKKQVDGAWDYYEINRANRNPLYTDNMFMSNVTFFRNGNFTLISNPTMCNVLTSPAVNMGAIKIRTQENLDEARVVMKNRMRKILYLFAYYECKDLVLGAFGCGVFANDPNDVAKFWYELLYDEGLKGYFDSITFSILDRPGTGRGSNIDVFNNYF